MNNKWFLVIGALLLLSSCNNLIFVSSKSKNTSHSAYFKDFNPFKASGVITSKCISSGIKVFYDKKGVVSEFFAKMPKSVYKKIPFLRAFNSYKYNRIKQIRMFNVFVKDSSSIISFSSGIGPNNIVLLDTVVASSNGMVHFSYECQKSPLIVLSQRIAVFSKVSDSINIEYYGPRLCSTASKALNIKFFSTSYSKKQLLEYLSQQNTNRPSIGYATIKPDCVCHNYYFKDSAKIRERKCVDVSFFWLIFYSRIYEWVN